MEIIPIILSGGSGTRLWPLSREDYPKQFLSLVDERTMLQETILRLSGLENIAEPIIVCSYNHRFIVAEQCHQIGKKNLTILLEPEGRNTAPAITASAFHSLKKTNDAILLVLSADHVIKNIEVFHQAIKTAYLQAQDGKIAIFGIPPKDANTEYGYIEVTKKNINGSYEVNSFVEKPNFIHAQKYFKKGNYFWNSGMFMFKAVTLINELSVHSPAIIEPIRAAVNNATIDLDFIRLSEDEFKSSPSESIDYALMEKSRNVVMVPLEANWNDIGTWSALYDIGTKDHNKNVIKGDVHAKDTTNTYINASHHLVATLGVDNLIIIDTPDVTFVSTKEKAKEVRSIVKSLVSKGRTEGFIHRKVFRPWGWYDSIEEGLHFQVKRLHVMPGARLSLQLHRKRDEHWVVVSGTALVTKGDQLLELKEGESIYIPSGTKHSLENKTKLQLEIIEVQSGSYLGEDDIERFEDIYGRVSK
ncbi:mannose-1-phosphate guanylyltransferase/mannose-6-phosphate isomerase [Methylophilaceae bacterium]|nr:mannose-1-phosphate guanylyltransferase/mannose-6-phosphate isomerase [Methylophilaceae bacterium]